MESFSARSTSLCPSAPGEIVSVSEMPSSAYSYGTFATELSTASKPCFSAPYAGFAPGESDVINSCKLCKLLGGNRVVVHTATGGKLTRDEALSLCKERLAILDK